MTQYRTTYRLSMVAAVMLMAGCSMIPGMKKPEPPPTPQVQIPGVPSAPAVTPKPTPIPVNLTLQASAMVNVTESNRPSSVVVRVYQLRKDAAFWAAAYDKLYEDDQTALGNDRIDRTEITLRPSAQTTLSVPFNDETRFVGIVAFFRQYDNKQWRIAIPAPLKDGIIVVDRSSVSFTAK